MLPKEVKVPLLVLLSFFILLFLYTKFAGPIPFFINSVTTTKTNLFHVTGEGKISQAPDSATINFSVTKNASTVLDAQNQTNTAIQTILDSLKQKGIEEKDIKTTNYSVSPNYDFTSNRQTITGYIVTQSIEVKIEPISKVNTVIDSLTAAGANIIGQVTFGFTDDTQRKLVDQARHLAVGQAKQKAQSLASAAGITLGKIVDVEENSNGPQPLPMLQAAGKAGEAQTPTQITPGENTIFLSVTLSYETY